jgi:catechol 2,3-dioxygenase-like lactoylglutathione lyase family enzyme
MPLSFELHHIAIQTRDIDKALRFYRDHLGFSLLKEEVSPKGRKICWLTRGGTRIELYSGKPGQGLSDRWNANGVGPLSLGLLVPDLAQALTHLKSHGIRVIREPYEPVPGEWASMIEGPDGEEIVLVEKSVTG